MPKPIVGLHHVTAIAGDPQRNLDFYTGTLGLRFVKKTINFDDPGTYHFYFGDDAGTPGTILTFFPWPGATRGVIGAGEVTHTAFSIPLGSVAYWERRLAEKGVEVERKEERLGETVLIFSDPDGMKLELVAHANSATQKAPRFADVPVEHAIHGFHSVTLLERDAPRTEAALALLGFHTIAQESNRLRFAATGRAPGDAPALGSLIDVVLDPAARQGRPGAGTVHHIAFRSEDHDDQKQWLATLSEHLDVSPIMERDYFRSIYFREPGGVLFELATDIPGFTLDEPLESLGEELRVPQWLDARLVLLTEHLVPVTLHKASEEVPA